MAKSVAERTENVVNHLLSETAFKGRYSEPKTLNERLAQLHTPGVTIAVINDFELEWARGFGLSEAGKPTEVTPTTRFQAGSISKPIFALAVMVLVQDGRLDLDEDINAYLKSWHVPDNDGWKPRISLRQLLSHSAGLTVHGFPGYHQSEPIPTVPQLLNGEPPANTGKVEVNILPGLQFRYSGGGTTVAQQILIDVLDEPFPELMRTLVLEPLGMSNSTFEQPLPNDWTVRAATAHPWKGIPLKGKYHIYPEMAAAGLWTTASDLAKAGVELLNVLHGRKEPALLTKETIESMLRPQLANQTVGEDDFVGLGFFYNGKGKGFRFGHGGWDEGFVAQISMVKDIGKGAVIMINSNEGHPLMDEILRSIAKEYSWPDMLPKEKIAVSLPNTHDYAGLYISEEGTQFRVDVMDGSLTLQCGKQPPLPIFPSSESEFFTHILNASIDFEKGDAQGVVSLMVSQEGNRIQAKKQTSD